VSSKENCVAIVVTFYPDRDVLKNIESLCELCRSVILLDNTPDNIDISFPSNPNLLIEKFGTNMGLAYALNYGMRLAYKQQIDNVFLLDQDSRLPIDYFKQMLVFKKEVEAAGHRCAFYVPNFFDRNSNTFASFPVINKLSFRHTRCHRFDYDMKNGVLIAITSGMLITYAKYHEIGPFPDDYFIDFIDNEYCLKAGAKGWPVAVNCHQILDHAVGSRRTHRFMGLTIKPNHHPPIRRYYIARNGIKTVIDYWWQYPSYAMLIGLRLTHEVLSIFIYEQDKKRKIGAFLYGCWHGLIGRMGECRKFKVN